MLASSTSIFSLLSPEVVYVEYVLSTVSLLIMVWMLIVALLIPSAFPTTDVFSLLTAIYEFWTTMLMFATFAFNEYVLVFVISLTATPPRNSTISLELLSTPEEIENSWLPSNFCEIGITLNVMCWIWYSIWTVSSSLISSSKTVSVVVSVIISTKWFPPLIKSSKSSL